MCNYTAEKVSARSLHRCRRRRRRLEPWKRRQQRIDRERKLGHAEPFYKNKEFVIMHAQHSTIWWPWSWVLVSVSCYCCCHRRFDPFHCSNWIYKIELSKISIIHCVVNIFLLFLSNFPFFLFTFSKMIKEIRIKKIEHLFRFSSRFSSPFVGFNWRRQYWIKENPRTVHQPTFWIITNVVLCRRLPGRIT